MMPRSQFPDLMGKNALPALGRAPKPSKGKKGVKRVPAGGLARALGKAGKYGACKD